MDPLAAQRAETSAQKPEVAEEPTISDFVAKEKYYKLKSRFNALREVRKQKFNLSFFLSGTTL